MKTMENKDNVTRILFVCLGNICRSPAAEGIMRHIVEMNGQEQRFYIDSAGIGSWHVGDLPDRRMRSHGRRHGYDFTHRARQFSADDFDRFDYIVGMDEENLRDILRRSRHGRDKEKVYCMADFLTQHPTHHVVPDPYYSGDSAFELVIELLEDACQGLFQKVYPKNLLR